MGPNLIDCATNTRRLLKIHAMSFLRLYFSNPRYIIRNFTEEKDVDWVSNIVVPWTQAVSRFKTALCLSFAEKR